MAKLSRGLSVGQLAARSGVSVATLHFYESEGLITGWRTSANHRRYDRATLRRVAIIKVAQSVGLSLADIAESLRPLPADRKIKAEDWQNLSEGWRETLDERIDLLVKLRDRLGSCIGCGCLSLDSCPLYNPDDELAHEGSGPRRWLSKRPGASKNVKNTNT